MTHTHVAGAIHGDVAARGPAWLPVPADVNALLPGLWSRNVDKDGAGRLVVAGVAVDDLAAAVGTPALVFDEDDLRSRARQFRTAFAGWDVYYAGKSFLSTAVAGWIAEEGLLLDVCTGGELTVALRAGIDPGRIALHGNNKSDAELQLALEHGVGRIVLDAVPEIARLVELARARGVVAPVLVRVTPGVEAHTHEYIATAREDQKFGIPLSGGEAMEALLACRAHIWSCAGSTPTLARRSLTPRASRCRPGAPCGCTATLLPAQAGSFPSSTWAAGSASLTPPRTPPAHRPSWRCG